ncbi:MAG: response regulator transcription factor [Thermoleophilia bacterium]
MPDISVFLADDHALFRQGLARLLDMREGITVLYEASSGREVLERLKDHPVDVVILDVAMQDMSGIEAIASITEHHPDVKVLVLTDHDDRLTLFSAIETGAGGYVLKDSEPDALVQAIVVVASGGSILSPAVATQLFRGIREMGYDPAGAERRRFNLSEREVQILSELATGKSPAHIAKKLFISTRTVQNHAFNIYRKLGVHSRMEAVLKAADLGVIPK